MYSLLISDGRPPPRWVSYFSRRHVVITEMFMSGIWPCMYVFVGIHFVMVATWLWKASQLFQFRVGFTSSLKFKNVQKYLWIMLVSSWVGDKVLLWTPSKRLRSPMKKFVWRALVVAYNTRWRSSRGGRRRSIHTAGNCVSYSAPPPSSRPFPHTDRSRLGGGFGWLGARLDWLGVVLCLCMYVCMYLAAVCSKSTQVSPTLIHVL